MGHTACMTSDRWRVISDRRRVRKIILRDQPVESRDLNLARRFVRDTSRFRTPWIVLTILAAVLLLADITVSIATGRWHWISLISPPLLILAGAMNIRDHSRAQRWAVHYLNNAETN